MTRPMLVGHLTRAAAEPARVVWTAEIRLASGRMVSHVGASVTGGRRTLRACEATLLTLARWECVR